MEFPQGWKLSEQLSGWNKKEILYGSFVCGMSLYFSVLSGQTMPFLLLSPLSMLAYVGFAKGKIFAFLPAALTSGLQLLSFSGILPASAQFLLCLLIVIGYFAGALLWKSLWQSPFHRICFLKLYPPKRTYFFLFLGGISALCLGLNWRFGMNPLIPVVLSALLSALAFILLCIGLIEHWLVRALGPLLYLQTLCLRIFSAEGEGGLQTGVPQLPAVMLLYLFFLMQFVIFYFYNRTQVLQRIWNIGEEKPYTCLIQSDYSDRKKLKFWDPYRHFQTMEKKSREHPENASALIFQERTNFYLEYGFSKETTLFQLIQDLSEMGVIGKNNAEPFWYFGICQGEQELANLYPRQQFLPGRMAKVLLIDSINQKEPIRIRYLNDRDIRRKELREKSEGSAQKLLDRDLLGEFLRLLPNHFLEETLSSATSLPQTGEIAMGNIVNEAVTVFSKPNSVQEAAERLSYLVFCYGMNERYLIDTERLESSGFWPECEYILNTYYLT